MNARKRAPQRSKAKTAAAPTRTRGGAHRPAGAATRARTVAGDGAQGAAEAARAARPRPPQRPPRTATARRNAPAPAPAAGRPRTSHFARFGSEYPAVAAAYEALSAATQQAGPLDAKARALVKLALAVGAFREGAVHSATGRARSAGCTHAEIRHAVVLATTTLGFPSTMAALRWVDDVLRPGR